MTTLELILIGAFILLQMVVNVALAVKLSHLREETNLTSKEWAAYKARLMKITNPEVSPSQGYQDTKHQDNEH